jgi:hypothetical protein
MPPDAPPPDADAAGPDAEPALAADDDVVGLPTLPEAEGETVAGRAARIARELDDVVGEARASIPGWDNLAWVRAFARAATRVQAVLPTTTHPLERRALAARLLRLLPPALLPVGGRDHAAFFHLPDEVAVRADDDFAFVAADAPRWHPSWSGFLRRNDVVDGALRPGRHERLLAPRSLSPGATVSTSSTPPTLLPASTTVNAGAGHSRPPTTTRGGSALLVSVDEIAAGNARVTVHGAAGPSARRLTSDGRDAGAAELRLDVLAGWLTAAGAGARGLDLRRADDRALLLSFLATLQARRLDLLLARSVDAAASVADPDRRADVVEAVVDAAADTVAFATLDPWAARICLPDIDWAREAGRLLDATGLVVDVTPRSGPPAAPGQGARELVWLDAVADVGFVGGACSAVQQARAFSRLAVSLLAPLGALPNVSSRDGNGAVITLLFEDEAGGRQRGPWWVEPASLEVRQPLAQAWAAGRGLPLAEPRGGFAHDVSALPAWLAAFVDTMAGGAAAGG